MSTLHQAWAILLSTCQQFCLVCCIPAYGWFAHWNWIVSWHCHFLAFSLGNLYLLHITHRTTRPTLSCRHWQYCFYASILHSATTWLIACSLFPNNQHKGETCCQLCAICSKVWSCTTMNIPLVYFHWVPVLASSRFPGTSLHLFSL